METRGFVRGTFFNQYFEISSNRALHATTTERDLIGNLNSYWLHIMEIVRQMASINNSHLENNI